MDYKEAYEEYKREHPEELIRLNALKEKSRAIDEDRKKAAKAKLAKIEACRRILYGEQTRI